MAQPLTVNLDLTYADLNGVNAQFTLQDFLVTVSTQTPVLITQSIDTMETAIALGGITPRWFAMKNLDPANFITVKCAASGTIFAKLLPGEAMALPLGSGATAPVAVADTAAVEVQILAIPL